MDDLFEIVFSFDTTGTMFGCLEQVRTQLKDMVQELNRDIPKMRIAIFAHGDYCDAGSTYVTKFVNFSKSSSTLCDFVQNVEATGGGDFPECYELVMRQVQEKLSWTPGSQRALVLIGDDNPHEASEEQNYIDWKEETVRLRDLGIKICAVHCGSRSRSEEFYQHIAAQTFGYYMPLDNFNGIKKMLMNICFREAGLESSLVTSSTSVSTTARVLSFIDEEEEENEDASDDENDIRIDCSMCKEWKPPNEFPSAPISEKCEHYSGICLRCVVKHVAEKKTCPEPTCRVTVEDEQSILQLKIYEATLDKLFLDYSKVYEANRKELLASQGSVITVTSVTGDTCWIDYNSNMTISELKSEIHRELGVQETKQKLIFKKRNLMTFKEPGQPFCLKDYNIISNDSLNLIVPLYSIPEHLDHVVFDMSWNFLPHSVDFLDASCLVFNKNNFVAVIDWNHSTNEYYLKGAIRHSATNLKTPDGHFGRQEISVYLRKLPENISHLYFTLSTWKAPTLQSFKNPRLLFYDASSPNADLCSTTFTHALNCQAVIMCSVVKESGGWQIFECDALRCAKGNTKMYNPLREQIAKLISDELP